MKQSIICKSIKELDKIAKQLIKTHPNKRIFAFYGKMGSGKTTFIKSICKVLGSDDIINSPTFSLVNQYLTQDNESLFHFDFYRIEKLEEVMDIGYEEYFYSGSYCFIEWPEMIKELLPENFVYVKIEADEEGNYRYISF
ncbi:MAG: tRNA (adenosine(37)-N6)-threonylcarbamoyltransferase complex ATPase subunit type 1 TsaE [Bacteroidales bacterium]|nr:tRNA (adenosine(37)-N6)-threonylcarbamoyltransferase complex ATPase subunit type 1 TsaE [Bacteroidales bacterium]